MASVVHGGRFDFDDGGTYCGGWEDGKAHGFGVCTGPKGLGEFSGFWQFGYEVSGVYLWPSGNRYEGQWMSGKRHGLGAERKGRWIYKGEWTQGFKGRYGVRVSERSGARYEGTWANGLQDGYGVEVYADGGTYHGQISQGLRSGYGVRQSVPYGVATRYRVKQISESLTSLRSTAAQDDLAVIRKPDKMCSNRGGFVLLNGSSEQSLTAAAGGSKTHPHLGDVDRQMSTPKSGKVSLRKAIMARLRKQKSMGDIDESTPDRSKKTASYRSSTSTNSFDSRHSVRTAPAGEYRAISPQSAHNVVQESDRAATVAADSDDDGQTALQDPNVVESYMGEWKADKRTGFGIAERSDGLRYEGEWMNNKKNGYGVTIYRDGTREEGKYKNNLLVTSKKKFGKILALRASKVRQRAIFAANNAISAAQTAQQKAEIAISRASNARAKAQAAEVSAKHSRADSDMARQRAREIAPDFKQPGLCQPSREPIILDIDNQNNNQMNRVMQERISNTLPYPTGLDYSTGIPGIAAATLYNAAHARMGDNLGIIPNARPSALFMPSKPLFMQPTSFDSTSTEPVDFATQLEESPSAQTLPHGGYSVFSGDFSHMPPRPAVISEKEEADDSRDDETTAVTFDLNDQSSQDNRPPTNNVLRRSNLRQAATNPVMPGTPTAATARRMFQEAQFSVDDPLNISHRDAVCEVPSPHLRRRKSLPCIVPVVQQSNSPPVLSKFSYSKKKATTTTVRTLPQQKSSRSADKVIIEDGIRKRVTERPESRPRDTETDTSPQLPKRIVLEKLENNVHRSIPEHMDSAHIQGLTRREICYLSSKRREELRRQRYLNENPWLHLRLSTTQYVHRHRLIVGALVLVLLIALWLCRQAFGEQNL